MPELEEQELTLSKRAIAKDKIDEHDQNNIRDLCLQWPALKNALSNEKAPRDHWPVEAVEVFDWLILLADRTCKLDLE